MAVSRWARFASGAPVPVFAAAGADVWGAVQELRGVDALRLVTSPRHAAVLLVAGTVPDAHLEALQRVHDQLPHPRAAVGWHPAGAAGRIPVAAAVTGDRDDVVHALSAAFRDVLADPSGSAVDLLPDVEPNEWRGVGPFGQGGEGMMGGTPYGRPMTMTGDDRDGLALDQLDLRVGPFLDALPAGLVLDVTLQGEVLQRIEPVLGTPVHTDPPPAALALPGDPSRAAARGGLRWLTHALHVEGLDALAARIATLACAITDDGAPSAAAFSQLCRRVRASGVLRSLRGVGHLSGDAGASTDVADRWRARMDAIVTALDGASTAPGVAPPVRSAVPFDALVGMTWTDAVSTIVSLDVADTARGGRAGLVGPP